MADNLKNGQSCLEKNGIEERAVEMVRSDYNAENPYSDAHKDALSDGDPLGKGTGYSGGVKDTLPNYNGTRGMIDYSNFDTENGGGSYDIDGRNGIGGRIRSLARSMYNKENMYGSNLVNTEQNIIDGQYYVGQTL